ncbi:zinc knuckle CX2CX4HX4C containing protein [Tanacetum coccineum]
MGRHGITGCACCLCGGFCGFVALTTGCVGADTVSNQDGGLQDGNTGNGGATGQVHKVTNDGNPNEVGLESVMKEAPTFYANMLSPTSLTKADLQKLDANVPNDAHFDIWLPLTLVHEFSSTEGVDSVFRDGPWIIHGVPIFLNKWSPSMSLLIEELSRVLVWVKFHSVMLVAYTLDGLSRSSYARILIEIDACNGFSDNLVMAVPNLDGLGYMKETIRVEYEWEPPRCSTCLIYRQSVDDCPKALKRVVNRVDKDKGGSSGADDAFIEVTLQRRQVRRMLRYQLLAEKCVLLDDEDKPLEKIDYTGDHDSKDEVGSVDNEMASFLAS